MGPPRVTNAKQIFIIINLKKKPRFIAIVYAYIEQSVSNFVKYLYLHPKRST